MKTLRELTDIGARAAMKASNKVYWLMCIQETTKEGYRSEAWEGDRPAREAFAQAIVEEARKEQQTAIDCLQQTITELRASASKWEQDAKNWQQKDPAQMANAGLLDEVASLRAELAKRDELIKRYKPRPVSVQPTKTDADHHGCVLLIGPGGVSTQALYTNWDVHSSWTHWLPCSVEAYGLSPTPEEIERREFEAAWLKKWPVFGGGPFERIGSGQYYHHNVEEAWQMWQARAAKEGKSV